MEISTPTMESTWVALLEQVSAVGRFLNDREKLGEQLESLDKATRDLVFYDDRLVINEHLVHYTSWKQALAILKDPKAPTLRCYSLERTNDPQEGRLWRRVWDEMTDDAERMDNLLPSYDQTLLRSGRSTGTTFGCCFSAGESGVEDNLTFWRLYGSDGKGCSFKISSRPHSVYRVRYLDERGNNRDKDDEELDKQVGSRLNDLLTKGSKLVDQFLKAHQTKVASWIAARIRMVLGGYNHLAKSSYFEDEKEWRMIVVAPPKDSIRYDVDETGIVRRYVAGLSLEDALVTGSSITVGPQVPNGGAARAYVEHLFGVKGSDVPSPAGESYDRWPVVNLSKNTYRSIV